MECNNGRCIKKCDCECNHICSCDHRKHIRFYCPSNCCKLIKCVNYEYCNSKHPKYILDENDGYCVHCFYQLGPHEIIENDNNIDCPVCYENNNIIVKLTCNHHICHNCWSKITAIHKNTQGEYIKNPICPLCRSLNIWNSNIYYV